LADLHQTVYPHKWSPVSCKSSAGHGKFAGQRPMFYHCAMQPTKVPTARNIIFAAYSTECQKRIHYPRPTYMLFPVPQYSSTLQDHVHIYQYAYHTHIVARWSLGCNIKEYILRTISLYSSNINVCVQHQQQLQTQLKHHLDSLQRSSDPLTDGERGWLPLTKKHHTCSRPCVPLFRPETTTHSFCHKSNTAYKIL